MQVITADLIHSTRLTAEKKQQIKLVLDELSAQSAGRYDYFIRGDSFQVLMEKDALIEVLLIKNALKYKFNVALRASIGLGEINHLDAKLSNSEGPAFWFSGQGLDQMKAKEQLISFHTEHENLNAEWEVHAQTLDYIEERQTQSQAEVIFWQFKNKTQQEMANEIGISQSSVNRRIKSSGWKLIEKIVYRYTQTLNAL